MCPPQPCWLLPQLQQSPLLTAAHNLPVVPPCAQGEIKLYQWLPRPPEDLVPTHISTSPQATFHTLSFSCISCSAHSHPRAFALTGPTAWTPSPLAFPVGSLHPTRLRGPVLTPALEQVIALQHSSMSAVTEVPPGSTVHDMFICFIFYCNKT